MILSKLHTVAPRVTLLIPKNTFISRATRTRTPKTRTSRVAEAKAVPNESSTATAHNLGKIGLAVAAAAGIGALCSYSVPSRDNITIIDESHFWPSYVKDRIRATYMYFGAGTGVAAASAMACFRNQKIMSVMARGGVMSMLGSLALVLGTGIVMNMIPYSEGFGAKQLAWLVHSSSIGLIIAPLSFLGGPILMRAALYTAGVVGGLSALAISAPSDKFLNTRGPLAIGLGVVVVASVGSMFMSPVSFAGATLYSISLYGGLVVCSGLLLYNTQRCVEEAKKHPVNPELYGLRPYDPILRGSCLMTDTINIFIRIAIMLAGGGNRRK